MADAGGRFWVFSAAKFRQSAADPPWSEADCRGTNLFRRVRGGFRVGNFYSAKNFFVGFRLGGDRTHSDFLRLSRTQSESAAELFRQLYYRHLYSSHICTVQISVQFTHLYSSHICTVQISVQFTHLYSSGICTVQTSVQFRYMYSSDICTVQTSVQFRVSDIV